MRPWRQMTGRRKNLTTDGKSPLILRKKSGSLLAFWVFAVGEMVRRGMGEMERQVFVYRCRLGFLNFKEWGRFAEENGLRCYSEDRLYDYWERVLAFLRELGRRYMNGLL